MVAFCQEVSNVCFWSVGINVALFDDEIMDRFWIHENHDVGRTKFETVDSTIFLGPLSKSRYHPLYGILVMKRMKHAHFL